MTIPIESELQTFVKKYPLESFAKNQVLIQAGTTLDHFFYLESGCIKMWFTSSSGQNLVLHLFSPGSCFSLFSLINRSVNRYDFVAILPSTVRKIPYDDFLNFEKQNPAVLFEIQLNILRGMQGLLLRTEQSVFLTANQQVAGLLLYFGRHFAVPKSATEAKKISLRVTHQDIAEWLGLSRENVSIQMKQLERSGLIRRSSNLIEILEPDKLKKISIQELNPQPEIF